MFVARRSCPKCRRRGRGSRIRTCDLKYPKLPRYQAALYPARRGAIVRRFRWRERYTVRFGPASPTANGEFAQPMPVVSGLAGRPAGLRPPSCPSDPGPKRTSTVCPGRSSVSPKRRSVSICTKISGVPSPRVRKPKPRSRLNHLTTARSSPLVGVTCTACAPGELGRMDRRRLVHREDAEGLQTLRPLQHLARRRARPHRRSGIRRGAGR